MSAPRKPARKASPKKATPRARPPRAGPGRPRKPRPPRDDCQADLAAEVERAEVERDAAAAKYKRAATVEAELRLLCAELAVASAWGAYLRAQGIHSSALKYGEVAAKYAARIAQLREAVALDLLDQLEKRARREDALGKKRR